MRSRASRTEPPCSKRLGRNAQHRLEEIDGGVAPERMVQALAETDPGRRRVMHRRGDKFAAAELEEGAVADAMVRRPGRGRGSRRPWIPIPRSTLRALFQSIRNTSDAPTLLEKRVAASALLSNGEAAGDEIEGAVVAEAGRAFAFKPAPLHGEIAEQAR